MLFLKQSPVFFLVYRFFGGCISTTATTPLTTTSGSFNKTGQSDFVTHSNDIGFSIKNTTIQTDEQSRRRLLDIETTGEDNERDPIRILYTITTLSEYDKGTRATVRVSYIQNCCLAPHVCVVKLRFDEERYQANFLIKSLFSTFFRITYTIVHRDLIDFKTH